MLGAVHFPRPQLSLDASEAAERKRQWSHPVQLENHHARNHWWKKVRKSGISCPDQPLYEAVDTAAYARPFAPEPEDEGDPPQDAVESLVFLPFGILRHVVGFLGSRTVHRQRLHRTCRRFVCAARAAFLAHCRARANVLRRPPPLRPPEA